MRTHQAASRFRTVPRLASNRKDTGGRIDWNTASRMAAGFASPASKRLQCGGIVAGAPAGPQHLTQSWSHRLIIRSATALRRNPGDITVGILDVAGFAVDAILRVDDEARP